LPRIGTALNDLAAGIVDAYFGDPATLGIIKGGRARAMAVISSERRPPLPDTPTLGEAVPRTRRGTGTDSMRHRARSSGSSRFWPPPSAR
jgi:tripartite-type tricarboxylate transporter receptor subunit TctC